MPTTTISTTLLESVNIVLANLGESPVNSLSGGALPQQVSLALNTIEEVSTDIQSKGWWFNQQTASVYDETADIVIHPSANANVWSADIPEEARRYITIRASRIAQTRLIGSEELQKFSYNEELVSLAILQQAHVRNSNGVLDFNSFPAELRGLGMDEVMFLQGNVEEKIGTLRLGGELANIAKTKAETGFVSAQTTTEASQASMLDAQASNLGADSTLKGKQGDLVDAQATTEASQASMLDAQAANLGADSALKGAQATTEASQATMLDAQATNLGADTSLKGAQTTTEASQATMLDAQAANLDADASLKGAQTTTEASQAGMLDSQSANLDADASLKGAQTTTEASQSALLDAQELKTDQEKLLVTAQKDQLVAQTAIEATAEKAFYDGVVAGTQDTYRDFAAELRIMGVQESMFQQTPAVKKVELLSDASKLRTATATETGTDATELLEVNKVMRFIGESPVTALNSNSLASECVRLLRDTDTELQGRGWYFNIEEVDDEEVIVPKALSATPQKYREYLNVRVAILLTELYPQSGVDIQRLPKMETELRAYFKDREFDDASYSVFDNYDAASRIGINRNYNLF